MRPRCPWHAIIFFLHRPLSMSTPTRARPAIVTYTKDAVLRGHGKFTFAISSRGTPHSIGGRGARAIQELGDLFFGVHLTPFHARKLTNDESYRFSPSHYTKSKLGNLDRLGCTLL
ncbi:hypothetical protein CABS01_15130 [Colletotrichum abscissum]|uniref:uncharacterized protein n=1 Tax=Colletotrichum abscissum TaxID=1671311 RepID=UPI0027D4DC1C|nr:uncharacterized protein CABS01_15130 [Colletotrichum abscissum]KAK1477089.1 hypothetical protein CABS01_15130 [Colletotrichum abscissum]